MHIPSRPRDYEKYQYIAHSQKVLTFFSILSFTGVVWSSIKYFTVDPSLYVFIPALVLLVVTYVISTLAQGFNGVFDIEKHHKLIKKWSPKKYPSVDIFLPICGEDLKIIKNTWKGVLSLKESYKGKVQVYALDDGDSIEVKNLAKEFNFNYLVRENRGHFKKAGNLQHGFKNSNGDYIVIFDADFKPRVDFLDELLPYFYQDEKIGIVQSPQYFDVNKKQNWVERGAGAVQEYFYRSVQQNRQFLDGAICVGTNAIYRREALKANGGTTLIEHSEDVHTGFDLRKLGWGLVYVPVILAKGVCPDDLRSFFRQQYRWCKGSMSLLSSEKFWATKMAIKSRICYVSGFLYYIQTAVYTLITPLIPLSLLFIVPEQARLINYLPLLPALIYNLFIFPMWHRTNYGIEVSSTRLVYGWAHLFSLFDLLSKKNLEWNPTGSKNNKSSHYNLFKLSVLFYGFGGGLVWVSAAIVYMITWDFWNFLPVLITGLYYLASNIRIVYTAFFESSKENGKKIFTLL